MGTSRLKLLAALLPLMLRAQTPCANTPAYTPCEMVFELTEQDVAAHRNPYVAVDLRVEFRSPRHRTLALPGYWDGGRRMVVRFSPTEAGDWDYRVTSNIAAWEGKTGAFTAAASPSPGFIRPANLHHWVYTEKTSAGLDQAHLWMGANEPLFATMDDAAFRSVADARSAAKFNHLRGFLMSEAQGGAFSGLDAPTLAYFQRLDQRVRYLNEKGLIADLVLAGGPDYLARLFPNGEQRRRFVRFVVARYAAMNVTWQGVDQFEDYGDGRAMMKEIGSLLKELDPYQHPRTSGARVTSSPLIDDGWMNFITQGTPDDNLGAVEHQVYPAPFVNTSLAPAGADAATIRHRLWNATMDGQYPTFSGPAEGEAAKAMTVWFDFFADTRHWELEPYFDVDGGRALALEHIEYVVYVEKPGPVELSVEKHGYDVFWINPATGESVKGKKYSGEHFTGEPPDRSHDWILHVVREGRIESMNRTYKFTSREYDLAIQEIEANTAKVPFVIEQPKGDLSLSKPAPYSAKITKETRATRSMKWVWMGEVAADHQGYRILATSQQGTMQPPRGIAKTFPAIMHLRLYGMNANGKVYELDAAVQINP